MVKEILKEDHESRDEEKRDDEEDSDEEEESEEVEKSASELYDSFKSMLDSQTELIQTQKAISEVILNINDRLANLEKAGGSFDTKDHKGTDKDIKSGSEVKVGDNSYQTYEQAELDADGKNASKDKVTVIGKTTETPRPSATVETVNKSYSQDFSPVLKDARSVGFAELSKIADNIRTGKYYVPSEEEVGF